MSGNRAKSNIGPFSDANISERFNKVVHDKMKIMELLEANRMNQKLTNHKSSLSKGSTQ
jgi:hypothetical protein